MTFILWIIYSAHVAAPMVTSYDSLAACQDAGRSVTWLLEQRREEPRGTLHFACLTDGAHP